MTELDRGEILDLVREQLTPQEVESSIVYWDRRVLERGSRVELGGDAHEIAADSTLVFVDLDPRANWGHACAYLLVALESRAVERVPARFPPSLDEPPPEVVVLLRYGRPPPHDRYFDVYSDPPTPTQGEES